MPPKSASTRAKSAVAPKSVRAASAKPRAKSDTDIMIEFDPMARVTVFDYAGLKSDLAALFDGPVDVVNRDGLKPYIKPALVDIIYAF